MRDFWRSFGPAITVFVIGVMVGSVVSYWLSGVIGPPDFDRMRQLVTALSALPGLVVLSIAAYWYITERMMSASLREALRTGIILLLVLPPLGWYAYPAVHSRWVPQRGYEYRCTAQGCSWVQGGAGTSAPQQSAPTRRR